MKHKPIIGIYGFGRFGRFYANVLKQDFEVWVYNTSDKKEQAEVDGLVWKKKKEILNADVLILCVPINSFETVVKDIAMKVEPGQVIMDTCSVKEMPADVMQEHLPDDVEIIATHPMFGPDSGKDGIVGLRFVYHPIRTSKGTMSFWEKYWKERELELINLPPAEHDKLAAYSQGVAHYLARVLDDMKLKRTPIDVTGFSALMDMKEVLTNDTWELFNDLQQQNKHTKQMRIDFIASMKKIYYRLFPPRVDPDHLIIGVQGERGSYSELACKNFCEKHNITEYQIKYLVNSEPVLNALYRGDIDHGVIAIQNAQGGMVLESIHALSEYNANIIEIFGVVINHCVLSKTKTTKIKRIISHEQALRQCRDNLSRLYPDATLEPYCGTALAAKKLSEGEFDNNTAVLAPETAAELYDLHIRHTAVQDLGSKNVTDFLFISNRL